MKHLGSSVFSFWRQAPLAPRQLCCLKPATSSRQKTTQKIQLSILMHINDSSSRCCCCCRDDGPIHVLWPGCSVVQGHNAPQEVSCRLDVSIAELGTVFNTTLGATSQASAALLPRRP
jgi:hypothetical protein